MVINESIFKRFVKIKRDSLVLMLLGLKSSLIKVVFKVSNLNSKNRLLLL